VAAGLSGPAWAADCGADLPAAHRLVAQGTGESAGRFVAFVPEPAPWAVGRHVNLRGVLCGNARLLRVDADMPAHRHGMNYRPTLEAQADGRFLAQGLMLHMPGRWRIRFEIEADGRRQWLEQSVDLK
jgi:hypothetical protein